VNDIHEDFLKYGERQTQKRKLLDHHLLSMSIELTESLSQGEQSQGDPAIDRYDISRDFRNLNMRYALQSEPKIAVKTTQRSDSPDQ